MTNNAFCFTAICFLSICLLPTASNAEQPLRSSKELRSDASHILVGKIQKVYSVTSKDENWKQTDSVAEIRVQTVEKGKGIAEGQLVYARFWNRGWIGEEQDFPPSASGHYAVFTKAGSTVRVFVVKNGDDNGMDILLPNGMQQVKVKQTQANPDN